MQTALQELYARFGRGDLAGVIELCSDDIVFHIPGRVSFSGEHTKAGFGSFVNHVMQISEGTFRESIVDLMVGEQFGSVLLIHTLERNGRTIEYRTIHLWRIEHERFAEWWEYPQDLHEFEAAWS
ncbi:MAG: nuclear transport factor 2 family protein [Chloroflexota bacterium]